MAHQIQAKQDATASQRALDRTEPERGTRGGAGASQAAWQSYVKTLGGGGAGRPLPAGVRGQMEASLGADLSTVRVHEGAAAPAMGAQALAQGDDVHFAPGKYDPGSAGGQALLGHELTHVVQQRQGRVAGAQNKGGPVVQDAALEAEAGRAGEKAARGEPAGLGPVGAARATGAVQRHGDLNSLGAVSLDLAGGDPARAQELIDPLKRFGAPRLSWLRTEWPECFAAPVGSDRVMIVLQFLATGQTLASARFAVAQAKSDDQVLPLMRLFFEHDKHATDVETEVLTAGGDPTAAGAALANLKKYNYDRSLMAFTQQEAEAKAKPGYDAAVKEADEARDEIHRNNPDPKQKKPKRSGRGKNQPAVGKKKQAELDGPRLKREAADKDRDEKVAAAEERRVEKVEATKGEVEGFLARATPLVGHTQADWIVRTAKTDIKAADALLDLIARPGVQPDAIATGTWAWNLAGGSAQKVGEAARDLDVALNAGVALPRSREVVDLARQAKVPGSELPWLAGEAAKTDPEWKETRDLVEAHPGRTSSARALVEGARAAKLPVAEVQKMGANQDLREVKWALETAKYDLVVGGKLMGLLAQNKPTLQNMEPLTATHGLTAQQIIDLLAVVDKGMNQANPERLAKLLGKASAAQVTRMTKYIPAFRCEELLDGGASAADVVKFAEHVKSDELADKLLLESSSVLGLNRALDDGLAAKPLLELLKKWLPTAKSHLPIDDQLVHRTVKCVQTSGFDKGTFGTVAESLMYHYNKHVVAEGLTVSVATYVADAVATGKDTSYDENERDDGTVKLSKTGTTRGGIYTAGKVPLTFWY